ncbi:MAG: SsrA-binding protein SmpB [Planctomycetes bacterium]|nr:SsrA-binding protein SmpB [Planctomycetota bacterium]MCW8141092.1 SsrA-binding protein SmpB [Planctomycetota bacterium]
MSAKAGDAVMPIARNKKAFHDYEVLEKLEAGVALLGTEVKSLRQAGGSVAFTDAYAKIKQGEMWLVDLHIAPYVHASLQNHEPTRPRKLLLHRREIAKLQQKLERQGLTVVPLELYFKRGLVKVLLGVARGKKLHDKRQSLRKRDDERTMAREGRRR